jgi:hypothetical protein
MGAVSVYQIIVAWVANSFIRPNVKRSASIAICNMIGNTASIYRFYIYPESNGPRYLAGGAAVAGICFIVAALVFVLRLVHIHENKLERAEAEGISLDQVSGEARGVGFRYVI